MKLDARSWLAGGLALLSGAFCNAYAQTQDVSVTDERPIAKAIEKLERLYRVPITYEDTLYLNANHFVDVTEAVRLDHGTGNNPQRVLVPARRTITLGLPENQSGIATRSEPERSAAAFAAVKNMLDTYALGGGAGAFTVSEDSSGLHVVSRAFVDASGRPQTLKPALETRISLSQKGPALAVIEEICRQISSGGGVVDVGTVPVNLLANRQVSVDARNEVARDVLESISKQIAVPLSWQLFCDPGDGGCALNMHVVQ